MSNIEPPEREAPYIRPATLEEASATTPRPDIPTMLAELCTCAGEKPACIYCESRAEIEAGRRACQLAQTELTRQRAEVRRLKGLAYIPGGWHCAKCGLSLISTKMHVPSGAFSADNQPHDCPNGCGPMWRDTERDAGNRVCERLEELQEGVASWKAVAHDHSERLKVITAERDRMRETLRQWAEECGECHGTRTVIAPGGNGIGRNECGACADIWDEIEAVS